MADAYHDDAPSAEGFSSDSLVHQKFNLPRAADGSTRESSQQQLHDDDDRSATFSFPRPGDELMASANSPPPAGGHPKASEDSFRTVHQASSSAMRAALSGTGDESPLHASHQVPPVRLRTMQRAQLEFERIVQERPASNSRTSWAGALTSRVLFETKQGEPPTPRASQDKPLCTVTVAQQLGSNYDELWVRTTVHRDKTRLRLFYIIPGNPGTTKAYAMFGKLLCLKFTADVCVISHLGHCSFSDALYTVDAQVMHHQRILRKHCREYSKVTVLGHSIGGYLSLLLADSSDDLALKVDSLGLLMPTVSRFSRTPYHSLAILTAPLIQLVVRFVFASLPGIMAAFSRAPRSLLEEIQGGKFFHNVLFMARDELRKLSKEVPRELLFRWGAQKNKLFIIYAQQDTYTSQEVQQQVRYCAEAHNRKASTVCSLKCLSHSFCLNSQECGIVVELVSDFLQFGGFDSSTIIRASKGVSRGWMEWAIATCGSVVTWPFRAVARPLRLLYPQ